ncbi:MAG TPA: ribosome-associated translation inhibitor RaiA [Candidatus Sulfotelmatobacter sp.]|nr:ribosome-associated translation inhibitor RaiA [Candidatus Sulfotelmatobacter sp.]
MFKKLEITAVHVTSAEDIKKYATKKIGELDNYLPKHARESAHVEIFLKEFKNSSKNPFVCEVNMYLPNKTIVVKEKAPSLSSAIDAVESSLKIQFKKYKEKHEGGKNRRHLLGRLSKKNLKRW